MIRFSLYDMVGVGVVVALPTGVVYSNQTGGTACLQPELEGAFLPVNTQHPEGDPEGLEARLAAVFVGVGHFDDQMANRVDQVLSRFQETEGLRVDRSRGRNSHEAWIHVTIRQTPSGSAQGMTGPLSGVLTWPNSD